MNEQSFFTPLKTSKEVSRSSARAHTHTRTSAQSGIQAHTHTHAQFHSLRLAAETVQMIHVSTYLHHLSVELRGSVFQTLSASSCIAIWPLQHAKHIFTSNGKPEECGSVITYCSPNPQTRTGTLQQSSLWKGCIKLRFGIINPRRYWPLIQWGDIGLRGMMRCNMSASS